MALPAGISLEPMTPADWPAVRRIYAEGIATGLATLERQAPDWDHFDRSHRAEGRIVARSGDGAVVGWVALSSYSSRRVYAGVAWESVYVAEAARGQGHRASAARARSSQAADAAGAVDAAGRRPGRQRGQPRAPRARGVPAGRRPGAARPGRDRTLARRRPARAAARRSTRRARPGPRARRAKDDHVERSLPAADLDRPSLAGCLPPGRRPRGHRR